MENVVTTGIVLKAFDHSEFDRRLIILTSDFGKITVFAKGVRRQGSKFMAASDPFVFGKFRLYEGKNAYNLCDAEIMNYFEELRLDIEAMCYASYFADIADYYTRENNDDIEMLKLLYRCLQALLKEDIDNRLVRAVYELKCLLVNGEFPGLPDDRKVLNGTAEAIDHIKKSDIRDLFSFRVSDDVLKEITAIADMYRRRYIQTTFKSLEVMDELGYNNGS